MLRKLFLALIVLSILGVTALAIAFPTKNEHAFIDFSHVGRMEIYEERHWKLLPLSDWGLDSNPPKNTGCGITSCVRCGVRRFGFIGIVEHEGSKPAQKTCE